MEALRFVLAAGFFGLAGLALYFFSFEDEGITVSGAELIPVADGFALMAKIENSGASDRLTGIGSDAASNVKLTEHAPDGFAIPAGSTPSLSSDGAHGMLFDLIGGTEEGRLVPVTFWFERAGRVTTRARIGTRNMDHSAIYAVPEGEAMPDIHIIAKPDGKGWSVEIITSGFTFSQEAVDGPHQPSVGHGHLFLNGLKLQRVYGPEARIGALPPGTHEVRVTLNTNDHRAYSVRGGLVEATALIEVD